MLIYSSDASGDLTAEAPGTLAAPRIVGQPVDQLVSAGDFASFSVVVANTSVPKSPHRASYYDG
jgi:hypothetical protein